MVIKTQACVVRGFPYPAQLKLAMITQADFYWLTLSLLMTTQEAFVDSVDQDQTALNVQSDL